MLGRDANQDQLSRFGLNDGDFNAIIFGQLIFPCSCVVPLFLILLLFFSLPLPLSLNLSYEHTHTGMHQHTQTQLGVDINNSQKTDAVIKIKLCAS